jgi:hypothetical protein
MICIKTGALVHLTCYDQYLYGDLFASDCAYLMRVCQIIEKHELPPAATVDYSATSFTHWFDKEKTSQTDNSTLVARRQDFSPVKEGCDPCNTWPCYICGKGF